MHLHQLQNFYDYGKVVILVIMECAYTYVKTRTKSDNVVILVIMECLTPKQSDNKLNVKL